jgi:hypothetical protein
MTATSYSELPPRAGAVDLLLASLAAAVPLAVEEMRGWTVEQRWQATAGLADIICAQGDVLLYGGKGCAKAWGALMRALAVGAYQPGGSTFAGLHWCAAGCDCPQAHIQDRAVHTGRCGCEP